MLYDLNLDAAFIIHAFDSNKVAVSEAHLCEETLEDYSKRLPEVKELLKLIKCEFWKLKRKS